MKKIALITHCFVLCFFVGSGYCASAKYSGSDSRDPFYPYQAPATNQSQSSSQTVSYVVGGVLWSPKSPRIIINGKRFAEGDSLDGMKIISIDKKGAKIKSGSREGYLTKQGLAWL